MSELASTPSGAGSERRTPLGAPPLADLARKVELEAALQAAPDDATLRALYFEHLGKLAASYTGLITAQLPEVQTPLYLRCGTPDISVLNAVFRDGLFDVPMRATPTRILVIGAYTGYAAVDLARRHPRAVVLAVEPQPDSFRILSLNTGAWPNIRVANTALWHSPTRLAAMGRLQGEWVVRMLDEAPEHLRTFPAMTVPDLLARSGLGHADMVVCDASGAERELFFDPLAPWLRHLDAALIRVHEGYAAGAKQAVTKAFEGEEFERSQHRDMELYQRRQPLTALPPGPSERSLIRAEPGLRSFSLQNVAPYGFAFFVFDGTSCQLHPSPPELPAPRAIFPVELGGHTRVVSGVMHGGQAPSEPIRFIISVQREDGTEIAQGEAVAELYGNAQITVRLPQGASGPAQVVLETRMAPGVASNQLAWGRFIDPRLV
jgi:FkbM family methyltransferase